MSHSFILVINAGSSSVKFALYDIYSLSSFKPLKLLSEGIAELVNSNQANISIKQNSEKTNTNLDLIDGSSSFHSDSLKCIISRLNDTYSLQENLLGIGHRVVHGGNIFSQSVIISDEVLDQIKLCAELAPLHNPANILGIEELQRQFPKTKQTAIFDTAFHQTIPDFAHTYAIPKKWSDEYNIRRYGFHGTSHRYITQQTANYLEKDINDVSIISAHLGNGASVAAINNGQSVDTSMGMTPLEGLVMGTRSGDIDPGIFDYLINKGISPKEINQTLNKKSGLLGISELSHDMRTLCQAVQSGNKKARLALEVFCFRAAKYIAAMTISLNKLDALVFTGGIGENSSLVRAMIIKNLSILGFNLNESANVANNLKESLAIQIHSENSRTILIIPTDEEAMIVIDTLELIHAD
jgi:acetate kinase